MYLSFYHLMDLRYKIYVLPAVLQNLKDIEDALIFGH